jgi:hypothetical protein
MDEAALLAAQMGVIVAELLGGADLPKAVVAQKYVHGKHLVSDERCQHICGICMTSTCLPQSVSKQCSWRKLERSITSVQTRSILSFQNCFS